MVHALWQKLLTHRVLVACMAMFFVLGTVSSAYAWYFSERILPGVRVGGVSLGGLSRDQAVARLQNAVDAINEQNIRLSVEGVSEIIQPEAIGFDLNLTDAVDRAFQYGHDSGATRRFWERVTALWRENSLDAPVHINAAAVRSQVSDIADAVDVSRRDVRLQIAGGRVSLLTDTKPGRVMDQDGVVQEIILQLQRLGEATMAVALHDDIPRADAGKARAAVTIAQTMIARPILLQYEDMQFLIGQERLGSWVISQYDGDLLKPGVNRESVGAYVTGIARALNVDPQPPRITTEGGRVTGFEPSKVGRVVQEDALIQMITDTLAARAGGGKSADTLTIPLKAAKMSLVGLDSAAGITEIIGKATTPFTGSPKNRISNIKNGVKFLSGTVIKPGEEFSTLKTLGTVDNTTGYLPELVIRGDRTTPDFGGGLCQVSTTMFRAVLNAGLPVTARRNHSYRVSYYEKDGTGKVIGPGLDATIYEPDLDFKFLNDTKTPILIIGYVIGDKLTFELYGTKDGRTSAIDGPHLLTETPPGPTKYIETTDLPAGTKKQVEMAHPGGSAVATYTITYADGHRTSQEFKSYYRRWPAQYLVGVESISSPSPSPVP